MSNARCNNTHIVSKTVHAVSTGLLYHGWFQKALKAEKKRLKAVSAQCCADLHEADGVGEWADGTYKQKWPKSW